MENTIKYEIINKNKLDEIDILNVTRAVNLLSEFYDVNCVVVESYDKFCGVALDKTLIDACIKAFDCDPINSNSGLVAFSKKVDINIAKYLKSIDVKIIIAPDFEADAIEIFNSKKEVTIIKINTPLKFYKKLMFEEENFNPFGVILLEKFDNQELNKDSFKVITKTKPSTEQVEDAVFAWKVAQHSKSVVIAKDFKTVAIVQNSDSAIEDAVNYACDFSKEAVLASSKMLQDENELLSLIQNRISLVIQPAGSDNTNNLAQICDKYSIAMITIGE